VVENGSKWGIVAPQTQGLAALRVWLKTGKRVQPRTAGGHLVIGHARAAP